MPIYPPAALGADNPEEEMKLVNFSEFFALSEFYLRKGYTGYNQWDARGVLCQRYYACWRS
jgi:hypothetical protein